MHIYVCVYLVLNGTEVINKGMQLIAQYFSLYYC